MPKKSLSTQGNPDPIAVQKVLKGVKYPARRQDLIDCANENDAPADIVEKLEVMADTEYASPAEVTKEMGKSA